MVWQQLESLKTEVKTVGGSYTEGIIGSPRFINPVLAQSQSDHDLTRLIFAPLLTIDTEGSVKYRLAQDVQPSADGLKYVIQLKDNIKFEDGEFITSRDVAFTIESIQDPLIKSPISTQWQGVVVNILDTHTVELILARPYSDFLYNLELGILPSHIWENISPQEFIFSTYNTQPVGTGPYSIGNIMEGANGIPEKYTLEPSSTKNEKTYLQEINFIFFENGGLLIKDLERGAIQANYGISPDDLVQIEEEQGHTLYQGALPRVFGLFFNQTKQPFFKSKNIRQAIDIGISKQGIVGNVFNNFAEPISSATGHEFVNNYNPQKARELIEKDGWQQTESGMYVKNNRAVTTELGFSVAIPNTPDMQAVAEAVKSDMRKIGINVTIRLYDQGNLNQNIIRPREYEALLFGYELDKPTDIYAFWHSSQISDPGLNISLFKDSRVDKILDTLRLTNENKTSGIHGIIDDQRPATFLYSPSYIYVLPNKIQGVTTNVSSSEDRFNNVTDWYTKTREVWPMFIRE